MKIKTAWAVQSLALCLLFNLAFTAVIFYMARRVIDASLLWVSALGVSSVAPAMSANAHEALGGLSALIAQARGYLGPVLLVLAPAFTLLLWFFLFLAGARQIRRSQSPDPVLQEGVPAPDVAVAGGGEVGPAEGECVSENG